MTTEAVKTDDAAFDEAFGEAVAEAAKEAAAPKADEKKEPAETKETPPADDVAAKKVAEEKAAAEAKAAKEKEEADAAEAANKAAEEKVKVEEKRRAALTEEDRATEDKAKQEAEAKKAAEDKVRQDAEVRAAAEKKVADEQARKATSEKIEAEEKAKAEKAKKDVEELLKPYEYTADEKTALESFKKEFPTEYAAMEARFKAVEKANQAQAHKVMSAILQRVQEIVTPLAQGYTADSRERHFAAVKAAHADHEELEDLLSAWIEKQPAYLKKAYQEAYDGGSTQEVIDLFTRFKTETGRIKTPTPTPTPTPKPKSKATDDEVASNTPVGARRATPSPRGAPDLNDYDGAFAEAAGTK